MHPNVQPEWPWPDSMDAVIAAPRHHTPLFENQRVRVLETRIRPGERTAVHTHRWPMLIHVLSWSNFVRFDDHGVKVAEANSTPPSNVLWSDPMPPHALENTGAADLHVISVELKS